MDGTPDAIRDVQFREKLRGYHPDDVDAFVQRVAEMVAALHADVATARAAVAAMESERSEATGAEESLRRTLVLAQRTADLAVKEAREEAARLVSDAEAERDAVVARSEEEHRARAEAAEHDLRVELARLAELREQLQGDVDVLHGFLDEERERVRGLLRDQLGRLDSGLEPASKPVLFDIELPDGLVPERSNALSAGSGGVQRPADDDDTAGTSTTGREVSEDDAFLAELRLAVTDDEPLGPRDEPLPVLDHDIEIDIFEEAGEGGRLGNRLRRRR